jgi:hypothetical protein
VEDDLARNGIAVRVRLELRSERDLALLAPLREPNRVFVDAGIDAVARREAGIGAGCRGNDALKRDEEREQRKNMRYPEGGRSLPYGA